MSLPGTEIRRNEAYTWIYGILFFGLLVSVVFSLRAVTSISTGLIIVVGLTQHLFPRTLHLFLTAALLYLGVQVALALPAPNPAWDILQTKSGIFLFPLAVAISGFINKDNGTMLLFTFAVLLSLAALYCIGYASVSCFNTGSTQAFFYHELVKSIRGHAVYHSIYVFIAVCFLMESVRKRVWVVPRWVYILLSFVLIAFLVLLSSRLVLVLFCLYLLFFIYQLLRRHKNRKRFAMILFLLALVNVSLLISTDNPVKKRFSDLEGRLDVVNQDKNTPAEYLNGVQFRLLQWRLVPQILNEQDKWFTGVGLANAQEELNKKYTERNMWLGDGKEDMGYRAFNTHNQFLQELLQSGIPGLVSFILLCIALAYMAWEQKNALMVITVVVILAYCFLESLLETQYGIFIFSFFPSIIYQVIKPQRRSVKTEDGRPKTEGHQTH